MPAMMAPRSLPPVKMPLSYNDQHRNSYYNNQHQKGFRRTPTGAVYPLAHPLGPKQPAMAPPPTKPRLTRRSSSLGKVVTGIVKQCEMRYRNLREAFRAADRDGSGGISRDELQAACFLWHVGAQGRHVDDIMADFDADGDATISFAEWCEGLKPFSVRSQPVFGLDDKHVTERHRVLPGGQQVLINDNLLPGRQPTGGCGFGRPDYQLFELPTSAAPASPKILGDHTAMLSRRIHDKFTRLKDAFRSFDENKDGKLSTQELLRAVRHFNLPIPREHVLQIAALCDTSRDGLIDYNEFASALKWKDALGH